MNLAIVHYHLNRGGVTRVIENQLRALDAVLGPRRSWPVAVIYGGRRAGWPEDLPAQLKSIRLTLHEAPLLDYDSARSDKDPLPGTLEEQLTTLLDRLGFAPRQTVLHVHNHALGKNVDLPRAVAALAERGYAMLLEPHDFAEDLRPGNFRELRKRMAGEDSTRWHGRLYPQAPHVHYAVLNGRDFEILRHAGVDAGRLHLLSNPVPTVDHLPSKDAARRRLADRFGVGLSDLFLLYPVRCIRRKNVGEALLYGKLAPTAAVIGLTLPPLNPAEQAVYATWTELAAELELPIRFELGSPGGLGLAENLAAADLVLTTSVAEGFGMVFLESWLAGRPLTGRDLPEITADFTRAGVRLHGLEPRLNIPLEWVGADRFRQTLLEGYGRTLAAYRQPEPPGTAAGLEAKTADGLVDFGDLDEPLQRHVIRIVCQSDNARRRVLDCNRWIGRAMSKDPQESCRLIEQNVAAINGHFSLLPSGRRLLNVYERVTASPRGDPPKPLEHADRILGRFLDLRRFRLIRSPGVAGDPVADPL